MTLAVGEYLFGELDDTVHRISKSFGGGMGNTYQETCGILSGSMLIIGLLHRHTDADQARGSRFVTGSEFFRRNTMIKVRCLVENTVKPSTAFWGEHGMAWHIQTPAGQILFDAGQSGDVLLHNAALFGLDLAQIDALVISHAHYDHTGGLPAVLEHTRPGIPLYAHADLFRERFSKHGDEVESIGLRVTRADLEAHAELRLSTDPVGILPGIWTTGEITDRTSFEGRSPNHLIRAGEGWQPDPYRDDLSLVLETGAGLVVLLGCGHAGLFNILAQVRVRFEGDIITVAGGTHLTSATGDMLQQAVETLESTYGTPRIYPSHCSGHHAIVTLASAFGDRVQPCPVGTELTFA